jgi:2-oxoglutarate dehydrogenase E2 component (dihydrolipoamide succinyltransferase)
MADLVVPALGESITEAVVSNWLKNVGDAVAVDEPVAELETDKITVQLPSPIAGALANQNVKVGATVKVGDVIGSVEEGKQGKAAEKPKAEAKPAPKEEAKPAAKEEAKPAPKPEPKPQQKPAGQPQAQVQTGGNGKNLDRDTLMRLSPSQRAHAREVGELPRQHASPQSPTAPNGPSAEDRLANVDSRDEVVPMSPLRKRVAERLVQAQHEAASLTTFNEVDMTAVMEARAKYKETFEKAHGVKLGFMSFFVKACVAAAKLFPGVNAEVIGGNIVYKKHYDFGIAVSSPKGLVVPVLRDCDQLSFSGIEKGIGALADKAKTGKLTLDDLTGGTFSITNGGIFGSMMSTPLLNYPQTGILGMHNIVKRPMVIASPGSDASRSSIEQVQIRPMMYVALSYDHRVVDGREAVSFLVAVKDRLEAPERLMFEV